MKSVFKYLNLKMFDHKLANMSNFHRLNIAVARQNFKWVEFKCNNLGRGCQEC